MTINFGLSGRTFLVTGANSGIGRRTAIALAEHGADVAVHYLADGHSSEGTAHTVLGVDAAEDVVTEIRQSGRLSVALAADLSEPDAPAALIAKAEEALGPLDGLINNAAACELPDTVLDADWGRYRRHYDVNLAAPTLLMAAFARNHAKRPQPAGRIVNISTDSARLFPGQIFYGTSKAALEAMTRAAAVELGPLGITVNAIAPGPVQTGYIDAALEEKVMPSIPLGRLGTTNDVASAVAFLVSDASAWITGQVIQVAGGHAL